MEYLVIGAGGTGAPLGAFLALAGKNVTLIARGEHLRKIQEDGLLIETTTEKGNITVPVKACDMEHYHERPDVIFVCVKGYSLNSVIPFIRKCAGPDTIVIPVLNIYGTGGRLQRELPQLLVTDGCIYIASEIKKPGCIWMNGSIFRVVYGVRKKEEFRPELLQIKKDLEESSITAVLSDHIQRDALMKFAYVSPAAACGEYYHAGAGDMQKTGEARELFASLIHEIDLLAEKMGIHFECDIVKTNLDILDHLSPTASTSMQRDVQAGKQSEMEGLIFEVLKLAEEYQISLPKYQMVADEMHRRGF